MSRDRSANHPRRTYFTAWARQKRARERAMARQSARVCPRRFGRFGLCGGVLETIVLSGGATVIRCARCERFERGICRDCPQRVAGKVGYARRCSDCRDTAVRASLRAYAQRNRALLRAKARAYYQRDDAIRQQRNLYKKEWRRKNPLKVMMHRRQQRLRGCGGFATREAYLAYHRAYRARKKIAA